MTRYCDPRTLGLALILGLILVLLLPG